MDLGQTTTLRRPQALMDRTQRLPVATRVLLVSALALWLGATLTSDTVLSFVNGGSQSALPAAGRDLEPVRGDLVARNARSILKVLSLKNRKAPYYSTEDRDRMARQRRERREYFRERESWPAPAPLDLSKLPPIEDIYERKFSGDASKDPIGGRKRYTFFVLYKLAPETKNTTYMETKVKDLITFFKTKLSCRKIVAQGRKSPISGFQETQLEYPMKEYGEIDRQNPKKAYSKAIFIQFDFYAPPQAKEYISKRLYSDRDCIRFMALCHTRHDGWHNVGEDNELHL